MILQKAQRKFSRIKMALQGPSGSGKTYSALLLAYGITGSWDKIAVIDSENQSSHLYADLGPFSVLNLEEPFSPERYIEALSVCEKAGMEVIIIDSLSHEWEGQGGILDVHGNMAGNSFANWSKVTPRHNRLVSRMLQSPAHVIGTVRAKQDYVLVDKNGKMVPEKVGLKGITRDGMDYEFTILMELDLKHHAIASKDRTGLFADQPQFTITTDTGKKIRRWCSEQEIPVEDVVKQIKETDSVDTLRDIWKSFPEYRKQIEPLCIQRKEEIEYDITTVDDIINIDDHGTDEDNQ